MIYHWCHNTPFLCRNTRVLMWSTPGFGRDNTLSSGQQHPIVATPIPGYCDANTLPQGQQPPPVTTLIPGCCDDRIYMLRRQDIYLTALNHISYGGKRYFCLYIIYVEIMTLGFCNHCNILLT